MRFPRTPLPGPPDATLHMVIARHRQGAYAAERDVDDLGLEATIADIMSGQVEDVERIIAFNPAECWSRDATEDIAIEIANRVGQGPIRASVRDFIEAHAGLDYTHGLAVAERTFSTA
jgi:hypothetical protein